MIKRQCDNCQVLIEDNDFIYSRVYVIGADKSLDLCPKCIRRFASFMCRNMDKKELERCFFEFTIDCRKKEELFSGEPDQQH